MKNSLTQILFWTPRILGTLFALFISVFALDVFGAGYGFRETALALGMHLIPTGILLVILLLAWRWEWLGAILFPGLGFLYLATSWGQFDWSAYAVISGPLILEGMLFLADWRYRKTLQPIA
jgi:hypothetical protein